MEILNLFAPYISDKQNKDEILRCLVHSSDKQAAERILM